MDELIIKRIHANERKKEIIKLLNESFPEKWGDENYFDWKFNDNNSKIPEFNYWIIEKNGLLAGCYGYVPVSVNIKGKSYLAGEPVDGATLDEYRRSGIFQKLMENSFRDVTGEGINFSYAIGTPTSKKTFFKCGWTDWVNLEKYTIKFSAGSQLKNIFLKVFRFFLQAFLFAADLFDKSNLKYEFSGDKPDEQNLDTLYKKYSEKFDVIFGRDTEYLKWRLSNPRSNYLYLTLKENENPCGVFIINHITDERIYVVEDYAYLDIGHLKKMLRLMLKSAIENRVNKIKIEFNTKSQINIGFLKYFFSKKLIVNYLIKNGNLDSGLFDLLLNTNKIHVTRLDKNE